MEEVSFCSVTNVSNFDYHYVETPPIQISYDFNCYHHALTGI